jgi:hypothetical protein
MPLLLNPSTAKAFCEKIATLLVALATAGGKPRKISMGKLRSDPPPATVLIEPAIKPVPNTSNASVKVILKNLL